MGKSTIKLTRRIRLLIDLPTKEEKKEKLDKLYRFQNRCFRAANFIVSHLYVHEMIKDFFYLSEGVKYKLADEKKDEEGMFQRSRINTTSRMVCDKFKGEVPVDVLSSLNNTIQSSFNKNKQEYWQGTQSLKNFKRSIPIPFPPSTMSTIKHTEDKKAFCFRLFSIPFVTYLGRDHLDKRQLLTRLVAKEVKLCTSQIQLKDGKIYWLAVFELEKEKHPLKPEVIAEATLSLEYPIIVKANKSKLTIGNKEEFLYRRLAIQASRKRLQLGVSFAKSGKGTKRKLKALTKTENTERNYVANRLHVYSRKLIDFCVKHQAGTLVLLNQEDKIGIAKEQQFVLRNWNYYELTEKIRYKAEKAGIEIIID
ncbi:hypothetical protein ACG2LH_02655 [Zhouia sp. PK063]|uniref:hypothetical protein n=1 Tax=Zhouia sp. PK063 TaxID=3373602 RepID=UPI0037B78E43